MFGEKTMTFDYHGSDNVYEQTYDIRNTDGEIIN